MLPWYCISHLYITIKKCLCFNRLTLYTTSAVHKRDWFSFMFYYSVWFPDDGRLRTETCSNIQCDITIYIYIYIRKYFVYFVGSVSWINLLLQQEFEPRIVQPTAQSLCWLSYPTSHTRLLQAPQIQLRPPTHSSFAIHHLWAIQSPTYTGPVSVTGSVVEQTKAASPTGTTALSNRTSSLLSCRCIIIKIRGLKTVLYRLEALPVIACDGHACPAQCTWHCHYCN